MAVREAQTNERRPGARSLTSSFEPLFVVMKSRWQQAGLCLVLGLLLLGCGLVVPVHLRALDSSVVRSAGQRGASVLERGQALVTAGRLGSAQLFVAAARLAQMPGWDRLGDTLTNREAKPGSPLLG